MLVIITLGKLASAQCFPKMYIPTLSFSSKVVVMRQSGNSYSNLGSISLLPSTYGGAYSVCPSPDGSRVYVVNIIGSYLSVINTATDSVVGTLIFTDNPRRVCVSADGSRLYVTFPQQDQVKVINTTTLTVIATIPVGNTPDGLAITPDGLKVYVTNSVTSSYNSTVSVISTVTNTVTNTITVNQGAWEVCFNPSGTRAYVSCGNGIIIGATDRITVINTATENVIQSISTFLEPKAIVASETKFYVACNEGNVAIYDAGTYALTNNITTNINLPSGLSMSLDGSRVLVVDGNVLRAISTVTNTLLNYTGTINASSGSIGNIVANTCSTMPLPLDILRFVARYENNKGVAINWDVTGELPGDYYEIQRSILGTTFIPVARFSVTEIAAENSYSYTDELLRDDYPVLYYRIKSVKGAEVIYSKVVKVTMSRPVSADPEEITVVPNPAKNAVTVTGGNLKNITLFDLSGKAYATLLAPARENTIDISGLKPGFYIVKTLAENGKTTSRKLIIN